MFKDKKKLYIGLGIVFIVLLIIILLIFFLNKEDSKPNDNNNNQKEEIVDNSLIEEVAILNNKKVSDYKKYNSTCPITKDSIIADYIIQTDNKIYGVDFEKGTDCKLLYTLDSNYKIHKYDTSDGAYVWLIDENGKNYMLKDENFDFSQTVGTAPTFENTSYKLREAYYSTPAKKKYFNSEENLTWEWKDLYIFQNKVYINRYFKENPMQLVETPENETFLRISQIDQFDYDILKTDKSYYLIAIVYEYVDGKYRYGLDLEYKAVKIDLLTKYYNEVLNTFEDYVITTDGYLIPQEDLKLKDIAYSTAHTKSE